MSRITSFGLRMLLLPVAFLRLVSRGLGNLFAPLIQAFDSSDKLSNLINFLSSSMASQRGLPLVAGTILLVVSWIVHGLVLIGLVSTNTFDRNLYWMCIPFTILHIGILAGFTGAMLAIPLGQSYKDQ